MDKKVKQHLIKYNRSEGWNSTEDALIETLMEARHTNLVHEEISSRRRWWVEYLTVVRIGGMLIGFETAKTSGDMSVDERGWEFDLDSIGEMVETEKVVKVYEWK